MILCSYIRRNVDDLPGFLPSIVHNKCRLKLQRRSKFVKDEKKSKRSVEDWALPEFPNPRRRHCGFCKIIPNPPHNSLTCPQTLDGETRVRGGQKKPLMNLADRKQAKERIKPLIEHFENYCSVNKEKKKDVLAFEYRSKKENTEQQKLSKVFTKIPIKS